MARDGVPCVMIRLFKHYIPHAVLLLGLIDLALLCVASEGAWQLRASQLGSIPGPIASRIGGMLLFAVTVQTSMIAVGVYGADALRSMRYAGARLMVAISLAILALSLLDFILPGTAPWRSTLLYAMIGAVVLMIGNRLVVSFLLGANAFRRRVLVLGAGSRAERLQKLSARRESGFGIVGYIAMTDRGPRVAHAVPRAAIDDLITYVQNLGVSEVVLALEERRGALPLKDLVRVRTTGVHVNDFSTFMERETGRVDLDTLNPSWLIFSDGFSSARAVSSFLKRMFDISASLLLLILAAPLIALFAVLVKIDSPGTAFYRQTRVGRYGQPFDIIKLRSMRTDAEREGAQFAQDNDPRITRVGRFIRKVRIDELPQTWSVLRGEMSFVGPRPERPQFVSELEEHLPYYAERHMVKPGITGWAQINYPYGANLEDSRHKLEYDLYYAKNYTPFLDLLILLQTLRVVLWSEGAR